MTDSECGSRLLTRRGGVSVTPWTRKLLPLGTIAPRGRRHHMVSLSNRWGCDLLVPGLYLGHEPLFSSGTLTGA